MSSDQGNRENFNWWKKNPKKANESVFQFINFLNTDQGYKSTMNKRHMKLYGNFNFFGAHAFNLLENDTAHNLRHRVTLNIIQSMVDTVVSKISKNKPKPTFLTEGGDWSLQQKAKKLSQFAEGQFHATKLYEKAALAFADGCIFGTGAVKIFKDNGEIKAERVFIEELKVDDSESFFDKPRQMHQVKFIHKDILKEMFPKAKGAIDNMASDTVEHLFNMNTPNKDMIYVVESWHLPSSKTATDGKHAITIQNETLLFEDWKRDYFPFIFFRWGVRPAGFFGQGIAEQLTGLQMEINKILRTIQVSMHLVSIPKLFLEASSKVVSAHLNNKIGGIIKYAGTKPEFGKLGAIPSELFDHLDRLYNRAFEVIGISQLSAQSVKPAGLDSGKALREFNDIETERFMSVGLRYQDTFLEAARMMLDLGKEIDEETDEEFEVKVKGKKFLKTIKWKDVDMAEDKYMMQIFPTSALSSTPAGRLQDVQELMDAGLLSKEDAMKLLDFPDLEGFYNFNNAGIEDIERTIELIIDDSNYQSPEPYQNLELGIEKMQQAYLMFRAEKAPESKLDLLRRWIDEANALKQRAVLPPPIEANTTAELPTEPTPTTASTLQEPPLPEEVAPNAIAETQAQIPLPAPGEVPVA